MTAILFGSISTLADTSELQRESFNEAFARHGLDWTWDRDDYRAMLTGNGGANRVADFAASRGETVDAAAVHATKSEIFRQKLGGAVPRPGVVDTIAQAKDAGTRLGFVTTTSPDNVAALFAALAPAVQREDFDVVVTAEDVDAPKPDPAAYRFALTALDEEPGSCVAVEDNVGGTEAASAAGVHTVAFPNANTAGHDFTAERRVDVVEFATLSALTTGG